MVACSSSPNRESPGLRIGPHKRFRMPNWDGSALCRFLRLADAVGVWGGVGSLLKVGLEGRLM